MFPAKRNSGFVEDGEQSREPSPNGHSESMDCEGALSDENTCLTVSDTTSTSTLETNSDVERPMSQFDNKICVGSDYQAVCPPFIPVSERKPEDLREHALIVWKPSSSIPDTKLEEYITLAKEKFGYDGEQALAMLFWHKHDVERAVMDLGNFAPYQEEWPAEDKKLFEQAIQFHGKNFELIKELLPDKSMGSVINYYYTWKKNTS